MKRFFIGLSLLLIIFFSTSYIILKLLANGAEDNFFNLKYREKFAANLFLRKIIGLHYDGDAKSDYLGSRYKKIVVEVDEMKGLKLPKAALDLLVEKMESATGKEVEIFYSDEIPYQAQVNDEDIDRIIETYRNVNFVPNAARIYLLYVTLYGDRVEHLGSTYEDNGMILFDGALRNFTASNPAVFNNYLESTALHEFGHQIGLQHNQQPGCLMLEHAEESFVGRERPRDVVTDFCDYEKQLIQENYAIINR